MLTTWIEETYTFPVVPLVSGGYKVTNDKCPGLKVQVLDPN